MTTYEALQRVQKMLEETQASEATPRDERTKGICEQVQTLGAEVVAVRAEMAAQAQRADLAAKNTAEVFAAAQTDWRAQLTHLQSALTDATRTIDTLRNAAKELEDYKAALVVSEAKFSAQAAVVTDLQHQLFLANNKVNELENKVAALEKKAVK